MRIPQAGIAAILAASIASTGCALLIPPSWRAGAPLPLAGPIDTTMAAAGDAGIDPSTLTDERLLVLVEHDRNRLVEIATRVEPASDLELREIANRLPLLLRELESRGTSLPGSRIRHPVIR
jgi:hypothetical protein